MESTAELARVGTRQQLIDALEDMAGPADAGGRASGGRELKTYLIESERGFPDVFEASGMKFETLDTGLDDVKILRQSGDSASDMFLDASDRRFFALHTGDKAETASGMIDALTGDASHAFYNTWIHSGMLNRISEKPGNRQCGIGMRFSNHLRPTHDEIEDLFINASGSRASKLRGVLEKESDMRRAAAQNRVRIMRGRPETGDHAQTEIDSTGQLVLKRGRSVRDHLQLVSMCKKEYANAVYAAEKSRIGTYESEGRTLVEGAPFDFGFSKIDDLKAFVSKMFDSAAPFKLWGLTSFVDDDYVRVIGIDLHTKSSIDFEISEDMMRVYLFKEGCGSTILRLLVNLQAHYDAGTRCCQVE